MVFSHKYKWGKQYYWGGGVDQNTGEQTAELPVNLAKTNWNAQ